MSNSENKKTSRIMLSIGGFIGVFAFFLTFFKIGFSFHSAEISGLKMVKGIFEIIGQVDDSFGRGLFESIADMFQRINEFEEIVSILIAIFIIIGPILFGIFSLRMLIRGLQETNYKPLDGSIVRLVVYVAVAYIGIWLVGDEIGLSLNFFKYVSLGFWLSVIACIFGGVAKYLYEN